VVVAQPVIGGVTSRESLRAYIEQHAHGVAIEDLRDAYATVEADLQVR
jgi:hypothetical protein